MIGEVVGTCSIRNFSMNIKNGGWALSLLRDKKDHGVGDPLVALKLSFSTPRIFEDVTTEDVDTLAKWRSQTGRFIGRLGKDQEERDIKALCFSLRKVKGVVFSQDSNVKPLIVTSPSEFWKTGSISEISKHLQLPIRCMVGFQNRLSSELFSSPTILIHQHFTLSIFREYKKPLGIRHAEALIEYYKSIASYASKRTGVRWKELWNYHAPCEEAKEMRAYVTRENFEAFFEKYKKDKIESGDLVWKEENSPYKV